MVITSDPMYDELIMQLRYLLNGRIIGVQEKDKEWVLVKFKELEAIINRLRGAVKLDEMTEGRFKASRVLREIVEKVYPLPGYEKEYESIVKLFAHMFRQVTKKHTIPPKLCYRCGKPSGLDEICPACRAIAAEQLRARMSAHEGWAGVVQYPARFRHNPLLERVKSMSSDKTYDIMVDSEGNIWCTCPAWKYQKLPPHRRTCKHIDAYKQRQAFSRQSKRDDSPINVRIVPTEYEQNIAPIVPIVASAVGSAIGEKFRRNRYPGEECSVCRKVWPRSAIGLDGRCPNCLDDLYAGRKYTGEESPEQNPLGPVPPELRAERLMSDEWKSSVKYSAAKYWYPMGGKGSELFDKLAQRELKHHQMLEDAARRGDIEQNPTMYAKYPGCEHLSESAKRGCDKFSKLSSREMELAFIRFGNVTGKIATHLGNKQEFYEFIDREERRK